MQSYVAGGYAANITTPAIGPSNPPGTAAAAADLVAGMFLTVAPTLTNGQQVALQVDANGNLKVTVVGGSISPIGRPIATFFTNDYGATPLTTTTYLEISSAATGTVNTIQIFDTSGEDYYLSYAPTYGALSILANTIIISPGGGEYPINVPTGNVIGILAKTATINAGFVNINLYG